MADIVLEGLTKRYPDGTLAVDAVDLEIADGEFVILVGPSGCGKSTTLNMIAGLEEITAGELRIGGQVMTDRPPRERDIAMVFQSYALYPHLTVRENLAFPLTLAKLDRAAIAERVSGAAKTLGLAGLLDRRPAQLSGGQRQRVAMGRALVRDPRAFLMDEPLSNLDARLRVQMRTQLARLQKRLGTTMVYVTHDQTEAMTLGDRVVVMRSGRVQQVGTPRELYERPANLFVAGFVGSPAMNFLPATVEGDRLRSPIGEIPLLAPQRRALGSRGTGGPVIVGLRPEALEEEALAEPTSGPGGRFAATVEVLEWTGPDVYAYFDVAGGIAGFADPEESAAGSGRAGEAAGSAPLVARFGPDTRAREAERVDLWFDARAVHLFDPETGCRLGT